MKFRWLSGLVVLFSMLSPGGIRLGHALSCLAGRAAEPGLHGDCGRPARVFVHRLPTYNQFQWMDHASFAMTGKVHVTITSLVNDRNVVTCYIRPLAYGIHPQISGNTVSFDLDQPRYLVVFFNEEPTFQSPGLLLFAEPPEKNAPKLGDRQRGQHPGLQGR